MELAEFVLARVAKDEAVAQAAIARNGASWSVTDLGHNGVRITGTTEFGNPRAYRGDDALWDDEGALGMFEETAAHIARNDPARVLAKCEAKRRIVERCSSSEDSFGYDDQAPELAWDVLRLLALPYSDHPDYDPAWKV